MKSVIIIPARQGSTRFPGKPQAMIKGKTMLNRVWLIAKAVKNIDDVYVATDNTDIFNHVVSFGGKAVMTSPDCANGTVRVFQAAQTLQYRPEIIVNLQGDAVLTPPWIVEKMIEEMKREKGIGLATPATKLSLRQYQDMAKAKSGGKSSGTMVVFDKYYNALYFSKNMIPFIRQDTACSDEDKGSEHPLYRHIGLYAFRFDTLQKYVVLEPTPLEKSEKLEQLRALENGMPVRVVPVDYRGRTHWSVDNPEDIPIVESIIEREGELF